MVLDILATSIIFKKVEDSAVWVIVLLSSHPVYPGKEPTQLSFPQGALGRPPDMQTLQRECESESKC